ncbi:hypothetical protein CVT26_015197 [Gymnopilus dilepis]|uniref:RING-type domain-containing protein n=1 Tax=Gymnopilus dilepis TaxID=231916 RepID=A0A409WS15_9AGAR|nr:hypothetical protein CVT26_015197 [Gymnopilus dilepis]
MEESHLGAEALCQICFEPFGQSEAPKVPYAIGCGHTICLGHCVVFLFDQTGRHSCLDTAESCCTICGTYFDRQVYSELLDLRKYGSKLPFTSSQLARQFQEAIARLNDFTDISQIRRLYSRVHSFLECQPRNRFTDLETNVRLIGCLLQSKEAVRAHNHLIAELSGKINVLRSDNSELRARVEELERQQKYDHADITRRLPDILRRNPLTCSRTKFWNFGRKSTS